MTTKTPTIHDLLIKKANEAIEHNEETKRRTNELLENAKTPEEIAMANSIIEEAELLANILQDAKLKIESSPAKDILEQLAKFLTSSGYYYYYEVETGKAMTFEKSTQITWYWVSQNYDLVIVFKSDEKEIILPLELLWKNDNENNIDIFSWWAFLEYIV